MADRERNARTVRMTRYAMRPAEPGGKWAVSLAGLGDRARREINKAIEVAMNVEPSQQTLVAAIEGDQLVIRVGIDCLITAVTLADTWPMNNAGDPCKIINRDQFLQDLIRELDRENEQGATVLHLAIDEAATEVTEQGYESVELPEDEDFD